MAPDSHPSVVVRSAQRLAAWVRLHPGRSGLFTGLSVGIAVTALFLVYLWPVLAGPDSLEPGELVIISGKDDGEGQQRQALVSHWNTLHPRNHAQIRLSSSIADAQRSEMVADAQRATSDVDIYNLDVTWIAEFADNGYILPLDSRRLGRSAPDTKGFLERPLQTCQYAGHLWALPFNTDAGLLFFRTDLVGRTAPKTWDEMARAAGHVMEARPTLGSAGADLEAGYAGQLGDYEGLTVNALEAIWSAQGEVVNDRGQVVIGSDAVRNGLKLLADGLDLRTPQLILPASNTFDERSTTTAFSRRKVVFMRNWPVASRQIDLSTDSTDKGDPDFEVAQLPGSSALGGQNLAVARHTGQPRAARALVEFLTSELSEQILFERGGFAATREIVYLDQEVARKYTYVTPLLQAIKSAHLRPVTPHYVTFSKVFREVVLDALRHQGQLPRGADRRIADALRGIES